MSELFLDVLNMSIRASWVLIVVLVLRGLLYKGPARFRMGLWALSGLALLCPFTLESSLSLIPAAQTVDSGIMTAQRPAIGTGIHFVDRIVNPVILDAFTPEPAASMNPLQFWIPFASAVWLLGIAVMLGYIVYSYSLLRRRVKDSSHCEGRVYSGEQIHTPFVLGILQPKIYLPNQMKDADREYVLSHEQAHIRRLDHWWKLCGFLALALHWFNPLVWLAYILLCKDIEVACDEAVVKHFSPAQRADYSQALLNCCVSSTRIQVCPLAFGEVSIKERVKNVLNYKKPAFWIVIVSVVAIVVTAVCFLTVPVKDVPSNPLGVDQRNPHMASAGYWGGSVDGVVQCIPSNGVQGNDKAAIISLIYDHRYTVIKPIPDSELDLTYTVTVSFNQEPYKLYRESWFFHQDCIIRMIVTDRGSTLVEKTYYRYDPDMYEQVNEWYKTAVVSKMSEEALELYKPILE